MEQNVSTIPTINFPNMAVTQGFMQSELRLRDIQKSLESQISDLKRKENELNAKRKQLVREDYTASMAARFGLKIGDTFYLNGYSATVNMLTSSLDTGAADCNDPDWLAIPKEKRPGYNERRSGWRGDARNSYELDFKVKIGNTTVWLQRDFVWQDNGLPSCESTTTGNLPVRCPYPAGSHYPLRGSIASALQGAKIKPAENDRNYEINWHFEATPEGRSTAGLPVSKLVIILPESICSDLRQVANHQNQYSKLLAVFEKRDWLESHSYEIVQHPMVLNSDPSIPHPKAGMVKKRIITFNFKMVTPKEKELTNE